MQPQEPTKKILSLTIDSELSDQARAILSEMGLTQAAVVTALFKRIVADGAVPFDVKLSDAQKPCWKFNAWHSNFLSTT